MTAVQDRFADLEGVDPWRATGRVARVTARELEIRGLRLRIGDALAPVYGESPVGCRW